MLLKNHVGVFKQILAATNVGWRLQFRFAVHIFRPRVAEFRILAETTDTICILTIHPPKFSYSGVGPSPF